MGGYVNGSDMLLMVGTKAIGSCESHEAEYKSETKDRAVKPLAGKPVGAGLWKDKSVTGLSISISADGLVLEGETETTYAEMLKMWKDGKAIDVACFPRTGDEKPYLKGKFVITSLKESHAAGEDSKYSISLENAGEPETLDESKFTPSLVA